MAHRVGCSAGAACTESIIAAARGSVEDALDHIGRTPLDLVVDVLEVGADDAEAQKLDAAEEKNQHDQRREATGHARRIDDSHHHHGQSREGGTDGTPVWRNPAHARRPRRKRLFSGRLLSTFTTLRSSSEKSPASTGIGT